MTPRRISGRTIVRAAGEPVYFPASNDEYRAIEGYDIGNGLFVFDRPTRNVAISGIVVQGAYRVIENSAPRGGTADCIGLRVADIRASDVRRGLVRLRYASGDCEFRDLHASGTLATGATDLPVGIAVDDTAHDLRFVRCTMRGFRWQRKPRAYWNGDGFSAERGNRGLLFRQCAAWDNSDGGFDLKSSDTVLDDCIAGRNARNYRLWSSIRATRLTSIEPVKLGGIGDTNHLSLIGPRQPNAPPIEIRIAQLVVRSSRGWPIFDISDGPVRIHVESHDIAVPAGTPLVRFRNGGSIPDGGLTFASGRPRL